MLEESVIYQDILQRGVQCGLQQGLLQAEQRERTLVQRQLEQLLGKLPLKTRRYLAKLSLEQVEALGEALVKFKPTPDLTAWLQQHAPSR